MGRTWEDSPSPPLSPWEAIAIMVLVIAGALGIAATVDNQRWEPDTSVSCQEDDPCWDCTTMGNLICGQP